MPWSNQSGGGGGGGWKSGGQGGGGGDNKPGGPWGQGGGSGGGGNNQQPDLEEILKRGQDKFKQFQQGAGMPGPLLLLMAAIACGVVAFFAFTFQVQPSEQGVVMRFGRYVYISACPTRSRKCAVRRCSRPSAPKSAAAMKCGATASAETKPSKKA
jgi:modulator of FtsH protease HflK